MTNGIVLFNSVLICNIEVIYKNGMSSILNLLVLLNIVVGFYRYLKPLTVISPFYHEVGDSILKASLINIY